MQDMCPPLFSNLETKSIFKIALAQKKYIDLSEQQQSKNISLL